MSSRKPAKTTRGAKPSRSATPRRRSSPSPRPITTKRADGTAAAAREALRIDPGMHRDDPPGVETLPEQEPADRLRHRDHAIDAKAVLDAAEQDAAQREGQAPRRHGRGAGAAEECRQ